jgi:hypothetical protein
MGEVLSEASEVNLGYAWATWGTGSWANKLH